MLSFIKKKIAIWRLGGLCLLGGFPVAAAEALIPLEVKVHLDFDDPYPICFSLPHRLGKKSKNLERAFKMWELQYQMPFLSLEKDIFLIQTENGAWMWFDKDQFKTKKTDRELNLYWSRGQNAISATIVSANKEAIFKDLADDNDAKPRSEIKLSFPFAEDYNIKKNAYKNNARAYQKAISSNPNAYDQGNEPIGDDQELFALKMEKEEREEKRKTKYEATFKRYPRSEEGYESDEKSSEFNEEDPNEDNDAYYNSSAKDDKKFDYVTNRHLLYQVISRLTKETKIKIEKREYLPPYIVRSKALQQYIVSEENKVCIPIAKHGDTLFEVACLPMLSWVDRFSGTQVNSLFDKIDAWGWEDYTDAFPSSHKHYKEAYQSGQWTPIIRSGAKNYNAPGQNEGFHHILEPKSGQLMLYMGAPQVTIYFHDSAVGKSYKRGAPSYYKVSHTFESKSKKIEIATKKQLLTKIKKIFNKGKNDDLMYNPNFVHLFKDEACTQELADGSLQYDGKTQSVSYYMAYGVRFIIYLNAEEKPITLYLRNGIGNGLANFEKKLNTKLLTQNYTLPPLQIGEFLFEKQGNRLPLTRFSLPKDVKTFVLYHKGRTQCQKITLKVVGNQPFFKENDRFETTLTDEIKVSLPYVKGKKKDAMQKNLILFQMQFQLSETIKEKVFQKEPKALPPYIVSPLADALTTKKNILSLTKYKDNTVPVTFYPFITILHYETGQGERIYIDDLTKYSWQDYFNRLPKKYAHKNLYLLNETLSPNETNKIKIPPLKSSSLLTRVSGMSIQECVRSEKYNAEIEKKNLEIDQESRMINNVYSSRHEISNRKLSLGDEVGLFFGSLFHNAKSSAKKKELKKSLNYIPPIPRALCLVHFSTITVNYPSDAIASWKTTPSTYEMRSIKNIEDLKKKVYPSKKKEWISFYYDEKRTRPFEGNLDSSKDIRLYVFLGFDCNIFIDKEEKNSIKFFCRKDLEKKNSPNLFFGINLEENKNSLIDQLERWCKKNQNSAIRFENLFIRQKIDNHTFYLHLASCNPKHINQDAPLDFAIKDPEKYFPAREKCFIESKNAIFSTFYKAPKFPTLTLIPFRYRGSKKTIKKENLFIFTLDTLRQQVKGNVNNLFKKRGYYDPKYFNFLNLQDLIKEGKVYQTHQTYILKEDIDLQLAYGHQIKVYESFENPKESKFEYAFLSPETKTQQKANIALRQKFPHQKIYYKPNLKKEIYIPIEEIQRNKTFLRTYYRNQNSFFTLKEGEKKRKVNLGALEKNNLEKIGNKIINTLSRDEGEEAFWQKKQKDGAHFYFIDDQGKVVTNLKKRKLSDLPQPCAYQVGFNLTVKKMTAPEEESVVKVIEEDNLNAKVLKELIELKPHFYYVFYYTLKDEDAKNMTPLPLTKRLLKAKNLKGATLSYREFKAVDAHPYWNKNKKRLTIYDHNLKEVQFKKITIADEGNNYKVIYKEGSHGQGLYDAIPGKEVDPQREGLYYKDAIHEDYLLVQPEHPIPDALPRKLTLNSHFAQRDKREAPQKMVNIYLHESYSLMEKLTYWLFWGQFNIVKKDKKKKISFDFKKFFLTDDGEVHYNHFFDQLQQKEEMPKKIRDNLSTQEVILKQRGEEVANTFTPLERPAGENPRLHNYIETCNSQESGYKRERIPLKRLNQMENDYGEVYFLPTPLQKEETLKKNVAITLFMWTCLLIVIFLGGDYKYNLLGRLKARLASKVKKAPKREKPKPRPHASLARYINKKQSAERKVKSEPTLEEKPASPQKKEKKWDKNRFFLLFPPF